MFESDVLAEAGRMRAFVDEYFTRRRTRYQVMQNRAIIASVNFTNCMREEASRGAQGVALLFEEALKCIPAAGLLLREWRALRDARPIVAGLIETGLNAEVAVGIGARHLPTPAFGTSLTASVRSMLAGILNPIDRRIAELLHKESMLRRFINGIEQWYLIQVRTRGNPVQQQTVFNQDRGINWERAFQPSLGLTLNVLRMLELAPGEQYPTLTSEHAGSIELNFEEQLFKAYARRNVRVQIVTNTEGGSYYECLGFNDTQSQYVEARFGVSAEQMSRRWQCRTESIAEGYPTDPRRILM